MTFNQLKKLYKKQFAIQFRLYPSSSELDKLVAERLLEPFESFEDALDHAEHRMAFYTAEGWYVSPSAIRKAVKVLSQS